jgi:glutamate-ammonia-ligase adenylyltransferase
MMPPELKELWQRLDWQDAPAALARLQELGEDPAQWLALAQLAEPLQAALAAAADPDAAVRNFSRLVQSRGERLALYHLLRDDPAALERLIAVLGASQYLADVLVRNPELWERLADSPALAVPRTAADLATELEAVCRPFVAPAAQLDAIRRLRRREMLRIGAADLLGLADLNQTTRQLSQLADAIIAQCLAVLSPLSPAPSLVVLALGKLGGEELNYSSDVDLVFVCDPAQRQAATRLAELLIGALGTATGEGFLYRVDLRLRPHGRAGALVVSGAMLADYLATVAQPAERQAMLKARPVAGDLAAGQALVAALQPVILADGGDARRQVQALKQRIERQLRRRGEEQGHVKLAPGGIRDIEFLVQALQWEHGRERPDVLCRHTLQGLNKLAEAGLLPPPIAAELHEAYVVLRLIEHRLQLMDDQQVHRLPRSDRALRVLARTLAMPGPQAAATLTATCQQLHARVKHWFDLVLKERRPEALPLPPPATGLSDAHDATLVAHVQQRTDVALAVQRDSHLRWTLWVALWDEMGVLALVAGVLATHKIDIVRGLVRCIERPVPTAPPAAAGHVPRRRARKVPPAASPAPQAVVRIALDQLTVRVSQWVDRAAWDEVLADLRHVLKLWYSAGIDAAGEWIIERLGRQLLPPNRRTPGPLPIAITVRNDPAAEGTQLTIRATDTPGFLFEMASALTLLNLDIRRVEIETVHHEVQDTFWVTDAQGRPIDDPQRLQELKVAATLIKQFTHWLAFAPDPVLALQQFRALTQQMLGRPDWLADLESLHHQDVLRTLAELMGVSQFLWEDFLREQHENLFPVLRDIPALEQAKTVAQLREELTQELRHAAPVPAPRTAPAAAAMLPHATGASAPAPWAEGLCTLAAHGPADQLAAALNQFKDREMFRIDLRRITRRIDLDRFSRELTDLAEVVVEAALALAAGQVQAALGLAQRGLDAPCPWVVCGLGKFGGRELGFASDIELLVVYAHEGEAPARRPVRHSEYFERLVQTLLATLVSRREGIFEIDLRLRPHGKAGSLATSLAGFRRYFAADGQAQPYERLALVKLRPVAGDAALGDDVLALRDRFVYDGRPPDYANLRHLRQRQATELVPPHTVSAKHSPGGLVDIEYYVQARQIAAGAAHPEVRVTGTQEAIQRLEALGAISPSQAQRLQGAYRFLRELIEALRVVRGHARDLTIPPAGSREFAHLARRMGCAEPGALARQIEHWMSVGRELWQASR